MGYRNCGFGENNKKLIFKNIIYNDIDLTLLYDKYKKVGCEVFDIVDENYHVKDFYSSCFYFNKQEEMEKTLKGMEASLKKANKKDTGEIRKEMNELIEILEFYKSL